MIHLHQGYEDKIMKYFSICVNTKYGRCGFIAPYSNSDEVSTRRWVDSMSNLIGYVGGCTLPEAIKRAGMMERDEPNAWGVIYD